MARKPPTADFVEFTDEGSNYNGQDITLHGCEVFCVITQLSRSRPGEVDKLILLWFMQICASGCDGKKRNIFENLFSSYPHAKRMETKELQSGLGRVAQLERQPRHQKVAGSVPGQDTYLGHGFNRGVRACTRSNRSMFLSPFSLPLSFSKSINISLGEDIKKRSPVSVKSFVE